MMLSRNTEQRPSSCTCIRDSWFSPLYSSNASRKGENKLVDKTLKLNRKSTQTKCRLPAMMSLNVDEWNEGPCKFN